MEFLFDTANIAEIKKCGDIYPYTGVTSNPSILKPEGAVDFFGHFRQIRGIIGPDRSLHIQVVAEDSHTMVKEAEKILEMVDDKVSIKIPTTEEGLKAMQILKGKGATITATAIYTKFQGMLAIAAGADYIAPYYNRMESQDIYADHTIIALAQVINSKRLNCKILAASFKNTGQVMAAITAGAHAVTVLPELLNEGLDLPFVAKSVGNFTKSWQSVYGSRGILDM